MLGTDRQEMRQEPQRLHHLHVYSLMPYVCLNKEPQQILLGSCVNASVSQAACAVSQR